MLINFSKDNAALLLEIVDRELKQNSQGMSTDMDTSGIIDRAKIKKAASLHEMRDAISSALLFPSTQLRNLATRDGAK
jgi:hypothetical protein